MEQNKGQIPGLPANPRQWTRDEIDRIAKSLKETPELFEARPIIVIPHEGKYVILGGNLRYEGCKKNKAKDAPCFVMPADTPTEKLMEIVIKDNGSFGAWDYDALANEWDVPFTDWGVPAWDVPFESKEEGDDLTDEEIEKKMREFREKLDSGEIREEDEEYQAFLEKFQAKKTTDDCFTPDVVYTAVAEWVATKYGIKRKDMVRPFYPGGDYQKENYPKGAVVVDNPPFSILSQILTFYKENGIKFFLFAPTLTLFSSSSSSSSSAVALPCGVAITYENGAVVPTSFVTNLEDNRIRVIPELYKVVEAANDKNLEATRRTLPKYKYPDYVLTAAMCNYMCAHDAPLTIKREDSQHIRYLDSQKEYGDKTIFGSGYLLSEKAAAEKAAAEKAAAEKAAAHVWELSEREWQIIKSLGHE